MALKGRSRRGAKGSSPGFDKLQFAKGNRGMDPTGTTFPRFSCFNHQPRLCFAHPMWVFTPNFQIPLYGMETGTQ